MKQAINPTPADEFGLAHHYLSLTAADRLLVFGSVLSAVDISTHVTALLENPDSAFVVREPAQDIGGVVRVHIRSGCARLQLSVCPWARGQGLGTLLLSHGAQFALARGHRTLFVHNLDNNPALRGLARRLGMGVAWRPACRSTQLEFPWAGHSREQGAIAGLPVTLADRQLQDQGLFDPVDLAAAITREAISSCI